MNDEEMHHTSVNIQHCHHMLETKTSLKKTLSPMNDKKYIEKNGEVFTTYSFGHKDIKGEL